MTLNGRDDGVLLRPGLDSGLSPEDGPGGGVVGGVGLYAEPFDSFSFGNQPGNRLPGEASGFVAGAPRNDH